MSLTILLLSILVHAKEDMPGEKTSHEACQRYKSNEADLETAMDEGVDADCRIAIEDGRLSCFSERALTEEERRSLKADGSGSEGGNQAAIIESKRNRLLQSKMNSATIRCEEANRHVREICRNANDSFKEALKDKETAFRSDLPKRQTVTSYAYRAASRLLEDAITCAQDQGQIYKAAAENDEKVVLASTSKRNLENPKGNFESSRFNGENSPSQREAQAIAQVTAETAITQGGRMVAEVAQSPTVRAGARGLSLAVAPVSVLTADKDDVTGPVVTGATVVAEAVGTRVGPTLFGGIFGTIFLHTTPAGVRCDGVFDPVEIQAKDCSPKSRVGAQSIESAARIMEQRP